MIIPHIVQESRLDWITLTCTSNHNRENFWRIGYNLVKEQEDAQNIRREWRWRQFEGFHCGSATVGRREDSDIIQLSGPLADEWFARLWGVADHCTRIDLCVTVVLDSEGINLATEHERQLDEWKQTNLRPVLCTTIHTNGRPETLYLGRRTSDLFARLYDKFAESGDPAYERAWRYELEIKGEPAQRTAAWLDTCVDRSDSVRRGVYNHFCKRGITPIFNGDGELLHIKSYRPVSDASTRLVWLESQVRPAVQRLLNMGLFDEVIGALGLDRTISERIRTKWSIEHGSHRNELWDGD
jgi:hypothetical protein